MVDLLEARKRGGFASDLHVFARPQRRSLIGKSHERAA
jgi:hypothetical protein